MAARRKAPGGRPLLRQCGGSWFPFLMPVFAECAELANGALIASLAEAVGCTRDTIYGTIRGTRGMSPDMLWRQGWALRDLGVTWMSGLLALGLEEQYDAHFYGVIGEAILGSPTDIIIRWTALEIIRARKSVFDVIEGHSGYSEQQIKTKIDDFLNHSGNMTVPNAQVRPFQRAWLRWYAVSPNELKFRENESRFKKVATPLTEAISILRESQRKSDPPRWSCSYYIDLRSAEKGIANLLDGLDNPEKRIIKRLHAPTLPELVGKDTKIELRRSTELANQLRLVFSLTGGRESKTRWSRLYNQGWEARTFPKLDWMSGLLALALFNREEELFCVIGTALLKFLRFKNNGQKQTPAYKAFMLKWSVWLERLVTIVMILYSDSWKNYLLVEELDRDARSRGDQLDFRSELLSNSPFGMKLREKVRFDEDMAKHFCAYHELDTKTVSTAKMPRKIARVINMLRNGVSHYHADDSRSEAIDYLRSIRDLASLYAQGRY